MEFLYDILFRRLDEIELRLHFHGENNEIIR